MDKPGPTPEEIETLHVAFRRAAELLAHGSGAWKITPNAKKAMLFAAAEHAKFVDKHEPKPFRYAIPQP